MKNLKPGLIDLFTKVSVAHELAFEQDAKQDEDWAYRYADMLQQPLSKLLDHTFTRAQIVTCLMAAEDERQVMPGAGQSWQDVYADHFLNRFAPVSDEQTPKMALYYYPECPFCRRVLNAIRQQAPMLNCVMSGRYQSTGGNFMRRADEARSRCSGFQPATARTGGCRNLPTSFVSCMNMRHRRENGVSGLHTS